MTVRAPSLGKGMGAGRSSLLFGRRERITFGAAQATLGVRRAETIALLDLPKLYVRLLALYVIPSMRQDGILGLLGDFFDEMSCPRVKKAHDNPSIAAIQR